MERTRGCLIALGVVFGIIIVSVAVVVGVGWYTLSRPIPLEQEMAPVALSHEAAASFQQKLNALEGQIRAAREAGVVQPARLEVTPEEVSSWAKEQLDKAIEEGQITLPSEINDLQVNFSPASVLLKGIAKGRFWGFTVTVGATVQLEARDGKLWYTILDLYVGNLPGFVRDRIREAIEASLPQGRSGDLSSILSVRSLDAIDFQRIRVEGGNLIAEGWTGKWGNAGLTEQG